MLFIFEGALKFIVPLTGFGYIKISEKEVFSITSTVSPVSISAFTRRGQKNPRVESIYAVAF